MLALVLESGYSRTTLTRLPVNALGLDSTKGMRVMLGHYALFLFHGHDRDGKHVRFQKDKHEEVTFVTPHCNVNLKSLPDLQDQKIRFVLPSSEIFE
jgi:hypothetical protein